MSTKMQTAMDWLIARLSENSTWRGILMTATGLGIYIEPSKAAAITAGGLAAVGLINVFRQGAPTKTEVADALATKADKPVDAKP